MYFPFYIGYQKFNSCVNPEDIPDSVKFRIFTKITLDIQEKMDHVLTAINQTVKNGNNVKSWGVCMSKGESERVCRNV